MPTEASVHPVRVAAPLLFLAGLVALLAGALGALQQPVIEITPARTGQPERCLTCHNGIEAISPSHPMQDFGCVSCHGGQRLATEQPAAHEGLVVNPAALDTADRFCGECHAGQIALVQRSLMATFAGAISLIRRSFGLQPDDQARAAIRAIDHLEAFAPLESDPPPVKQFAENCLGCHLAAEPRQAAYYHRSTGCAACHVLYADDGLYQGSDPTVPRDEPGHPAQHTFTTAIPYTQCNHCHNRGVYDLRSMAFLERQDMPPPDGLTPAEKRLHEYYQPVGAFTRCEWELDCIDCHTALEVMGDAQLYSSRSQAQYTQCSTCHGTLDAPPAERLIELEEDPAMVKARLNPFVELTVGASVIVTARGEAFWHVQKEGDGWWLTGKATGQRYAVPLAQGSGCQQQPDEQASHYCHECHAYER